MLDAAPAEIPRARREHAFATALVILLVLFRSAIFVFWEQAHFDSDQAITGLMAKHLADGRAFPVFWYGQNYMLAVESWLAAPLFLAAGASVAALKLPLLVINVVIAVLLLRLFERDVALRPMFAALATLPFVLPAPGSAARIVEANGGNVEPFLYILLIWLTRARPLWCGVVLGVGFLQREFAIYGFAALLLIDSLSRRLLTRATLSARGVSTLVAAAIWVFVQWAKQFASAAGPGTTLADVYNPRSNLAELLSRTCFDPATAVGGVQKLFTAHWPVLFGVTPMPLTDFGIESRGWQGASWAWIPLAAGFAIVGVSIVLSLLRARVRDERLAFPAFLVTVGLLSVVGYILGRCGALDFYYMRYELLSLLAATGLIAMFVRLERSTLIRALVAVTLGTWLLVNVVPHVKLWSEYLTAAPAGGKQLVLQALESEGYRYAEADYWLAYALTFMSDERIIVASNDFQRIPAYTKIVAANRERAIRIARAPCAGGREILRRVYFCPM